MTGNCYLCHRWTELHRHHMLHGSRRKKAEEWGLVVGLCPQCHRLLHDKGDHDLELERVAQRIFEKEHGRAKWMEEFGKNYLE